MKRLLIILPILFLCLCSFVDADTVDVYTGDISFIDSEYNVTRLSGNIEYYLDDYSYLGLSSGGHLFNASNITLNGTAIISGTEYNIRMQPRSGFEIQQTYITNNMTRTVWVSYNLTPDIIPSSWDVPQLAPVLLVILALIIVCFVIFKGILI